MCFLSVFFLKKNRRFSHINADFFIITTKDTADIVRIGTQKLL